MRVLGIETSRQMLMYRRPQTHFGHSACKYSRLIKLCLRFLRDTGPRGDVRLQEAGIFKGVGGNRFERMALTREQMAVA